MGAAARPPGGHRQQGGPSRRGRPTADPAGSRARPRRAPHGVRPGADPGPDDDRGA